jgi:hypothetical protein
MTKITITKSIRLSPAESKEVARLSVKTSITEATLMKKWVQAGIRAEKLELAIQTYMQRQIDLRGGAALAEVSYNYFLQQLQARNIVILDDDRFLERLFSLAEVFDDQTLQVAVGEVVAQQNNRLQPEATGQSS